MANTIVDVTEESLTKILDTDKVVLIDFWADWCAPCKMLNPILAEVAKESQDEIVFGKLNIDTYKDAPVEYGVRGIPTILIFKNGTVIASKTGVLSKSELQAFIKEN